MGTPSDIIGAIEKIQESLYSAKRQNQLRDLKICLFQNLMIRLQKFSSLPKCDVMIHEQDISRLNETILNILKGAELPLECQMVCSKAFCAGVLLIHDDPLVALQKCCDILKESSSKSVVNERLIYDAFNSQTEDIFNVCLCLALVELNVKVWLSCDVNNNNIILLDVIYPICEKVAYKYSSVTLLAFRCLVKVFELLRSLNHSNYILIYEYVTRTMNVVMSNWENQLTSVREQNSLLFYNLLQLTVNKQWSSCVCIKEDIFSCDSFSNNPLLYLIFNQQSWMIKSKYFLLSEIFKNKNLYEIIYSYKEELVVGLKISLQFTYLAAAGSDLYKVCVSKMETSEWKEIFLPVIREVLKSNGNSLMKQNLVTYWMPYSLKFNKGSFHVLYDFVINLPSTNLSSFILLFKIGRKEGSINWGENNEKLKSGDEYNKLKTCLIHSDESIRSDAFVSVCVSKETNTVPTLEEINLIKQFLIENISYDSARLRQSIIGSFTLLLIRFRDSFLFKLKNNGMNFMKLYDDNDLKNTIEFILWLHRFLIDNLEDGCNYQRKYTSLLLYETVLNYLEDQKTTVFLRKSNNNHFGFKLREFTERLEKWEFSSDESKNTLFSCILDQSESVQNIAANILSNYFYLTENDLINDEILPWYQKGIDLCSDKYFYCAGSGALILKTVTILLYKKSKGNDSFDENKNDENILSKFLKKKKNIVGELLSIAETQKDELFKDVLKAASNGSPLHGILSAIKLLLTDRKSPEYGCLSFQDVEKLLVLLESVINKLLNDLSSSSKIADFAPSFADMGEAIESIAQRSTIRSESEFNADDDDVDNDDYRDVNVQLSSAHQLILNCIWLNIKTCSVLAERLVTSSLLESDVKNIERCVELIGCVLRRCRHKGAIETAGLSMMHITRYLTSHKNEKFRNIPCKILNEIFTTLMASDSGTVSRRSAGLTILVHRIIVGDCSPRKPLLHSCMVKLIEIAGKDVGESYNELVDLPQARALHFISSLVEDSVLRQEVSHHIHDIAALCFHNLSSNIWMIRNAALQLFGALLPKLIGSKKHLETDDLSETYAIPVEELYFHVENLFDLIDKQLYAVGFTNDIMEHSYLMPSLTLLSNLTVTIHTCLNVDLKNSVKKFSLYLEKLFSSPIYHVRKLAAKINSNFCMPFQLNDLIKSRINQILMEFSLNDNEKNKLHGLLLNLKFLMAKFYKLKDSLFYLRNYEGNILSSLRGLLKIIKSVNVPSFIKGLCCDILLYDHYTNNDHISLFNNYVGKHEASKHMECNIASRNVGFPLLCHGEIQLSFLNTNLDELSSRIEFFLESDVGDINISCLKCIKLRVIRVENINFNLLKNILDILINFIIERNKIEVISVAFDVVLSVINSIKDFDLNKDNYVNKTGIIFDKYLKGVADYGTKCSGLALPVVCYLISKELPSHFLKNIVSLIWKYSHPNEHNEELRLASVESLYFLIPFLKLKSFENEEGILIWKSVCNFLQDEDVGIRIEVTKFVTEFYDDKFECKLKYINPYVSLCFIYRIDFMDRLMDYKSALNCLWSMLEVTINDENDSNIENLNPFDHGLSNIYKEEVKIVDLVAREIERLISCEEYKCYLYDVVKSKNFTSNSILNIEKNFLTDKKLKLQEKICSRLLINEP